MEFGIAFNQQFSEFLLVKQFKSGITEKNCQLREKSIFLDEIASILLTLKVK